MKNLIGKLAAAELLGKPVTWVSWAVQRKKIPYIRLGQQIRFDPDSLACWLREHEVQAETSAHRTEIDLKASNIDALLQRVREHVASGGRIVMVNP